MAIELNDDDKRKLNDLKELLDFGQNSFKSISKGWYEVKRRKQLLSQMFAAVHSQTESISILLETGRTFSVEILLRPVQETLINANYILIGRNNFTANRFLVGSNSKLIKQINKMIRYQSNNPTHNPGAPEMDLVALQKTSLKRESENRSYLDRFSYPIPQNETSVEERVIAIDKEYVRLRQNLPSLSQQWMYLTQYWLASEQVHLTARGLMNYTGVTDDSVILFLDGDKDAIERYIVIASAMYLDMLYIINSQFNVPAKKELNIWKKRIRDNSLSGPKSTEGKKVVGLRAKKSINAQSSKS